MDDHAQMELIEVILAAAMILLALYFVKNIEIAPQTDIEEENNLKVYGDNVLESLASIPDTTGEYHSLLAYFVAKANGNNVYTTWLLNNVSSRLPSNMFYQIYKLNVSKLVGESGETFESCKTVLYEPSVWVKEESRSSRIVVTDGYIYEIVLSLFYNIGS